MYCRACGHLTRSIISLGNLPLANALLESIPRNQEPHYNLEVMLCTNCHLAQLRDVVCPTDLFSNYIYFSSHSDTMLAYAASLVERMIPTLSSNPFVIEIASNDGYLLKNYVERNIQALGIDPAQNIAAIANEKGIPTLPDFFSKNLATKLSHEKKQADIIHANNVMAHVPDINDFLEGIYILLKPKGIAIIEVPYFVDLIQKLEFDTIYHEHVYYFAVKPLCAAFSRASLEIFTIEKLPIHGGTLRLFVGHKGAHPIQPIVQNLVQAEMKSGFFETSLYVQFMEKLHHLKTELRDTLHSIKHKGKKIAAYGASAKGTTLLNFFGIGGDLVDFVVDRSPAKQGLLTPGTHLPIKSPEALIKEKVHYALLLTWNFAEEILAQQAEFMGKAGKFIIPLPSVKIIETCST